MKLLDKKNLISLILVLILYAVMQLMITTGFINSYLLMNIIIIGINIILAVSLNLITGFTGQFSLGHAAFMSVGAYTSAIATAKLGLPFPVGILLAAVASGLAGILIGIPTLRLKGDYLAIATLGFGKIIEIIWLNTEYVGGASGFNDIPQYTTFTWVFFAIVVAIVIIKNFINSDGGRSCIAIREDEVAAEAMGVNTTYYKVLAFSMGALFAGVAGALHANYFYFIKPFDFSFNRSIDILVIVVFGGLGSITGSVVGAVVLALISLFLQRYPEFRMIIYSVILFLIMLYRPKGLLGNYELKLPGLKGGKLNANTRGK